MRVLLLGEFSGFHRYLKEGLMELNDVSSVELYANGDGWKAIGGADGLLYQNAYGCPGRVKRYIDSFQRVKQFQGYDIVQLINTGVYPAAITPKLISTLRKNNRCLSLVAAGGDHALSQAYHEGKLSDYAFDYDRTGIVRYDVHTLSGKINVRADQSVVEAAKIIIPSLYEYTVGYHENDKLSKVIPFPINLKNIEYSENIVHDKVVFFHGLNRELEKGTPFIRKALQRLKEEYPDDVEVIIDGRMPFEQYLDVIKRTNVVVDQCCSYGYGINACIAMAQGKVVMSGNRKENQNALGCDYIPIISIKPDEEQIYQQMVYIIKNRDNITRMGYESRKYVEKVHDYVKVAKLYIEIWKRALEK